jgi:UPF0755 protein
MMRFGLKLKKTKAKSLGYTIPELVTIASIVQSESGIKTEQQKIAGVYINRLKQDMKLQADPTVVFANGNFDVQRVLNRLIKTLIHLIILIATKDYLQDLFV